MPINVTPATRRAFNALRVAGAAILLSLAAFVGIPTAAWGATSTSSMTEWTVTNQPSGTLRHNLDLLTLDNAGRGINEVTVTRVDNTTGSFQFQIYAMCRADGAAGLGSYDGTGALPSGWTDLLGDVFRNSTTDTLSATDSVTTYARSGFMTNLCAAGSTVAGLRSTVWNGSAYERTVWQLDAPPVPSTCPTSFLTPAAAYAGGVLSVRFGWSGALPVKDWRVHAPGNGSTLTAAANTTTVTRIKPAGSATYARDYTATLTLPVDASQIRVSRGDDFSCYIVLTVHATLDEAVAGSGSDPDTGEACSSWDVFCQIRSAFTPDPATLEQFGDLGADAGRIVPFGYITDSLDYLTFLDDTCGLACDDDKLTTGFCFQIGVLAQAGDDVCPFAEGTTVRSFLESQRTLLSTFAWASVLVPLVAFVWRKSVPFINGGS